MAKLADYIETMPKAELHCHLDGSVPLETLEALTTEAGLDIDMASLAIAPKRCEDLKEYLTAFNTILQVLQTADQLKRATIAIIEAVAKEHVRYIELRFAPLLHTEQGLSVPEVIDAVMSGIREAGPKNHVYINLILCHMRHMDQATQLRLVEAIQNHPVPEVVAFDFAGNEPDHANDEIGPVATAGIEAGYALTLHSGECGCVENVVAAIHLGATRIGHGVAIEQSEEALQLARDRHIHMEVCPTSNYQTGAINSIVDSHLQTLMDWGISCSINTDNRTVSNTTLTQEFMQVQEAFNLTQTDIYQLSCQAMRAAFAKATVKDEILHEMAQHDRHYNHK
ncbi:MAG: adenosine deaminase [Aerococcus sp.]|nr:adenosine deaminase [Aerococcus sp.]